MNYNYPPELPITEQQEEIIAAIRHHQVTIIAGDTGSGKTTQLPKMCLEAGRGVDKIIGCTQPRRIAAITVADRVAAEIQSRELVGYKIRFHDHTSQTTRIKFMTDGILLAESRTNKNLHGYDTIIIDEAHERSLNIDFLLGYLKYLLPIRKDLKLIISSATIDTDKFATHFDKAPVINVTGRTHPISLHYSPLQGEKNEFDTGYVEPAVAEIKKLLSDSRGDILVFMPTERDIRETVTMLEKQTFGNLILPLFGRLQAKDQRRIFKPVTKRKIIVATNVAETSITVPGIRYVVDTGLARLSRYNFRAKTTNLRISRISRASCDQRMGRCGRTGPGVCIRLFSEEDYHNRPEFTQPEIQRSNLAEVILRMIQLRFGDPRKFPFMDPPTGRAISDGYKLLKELGALSKKNQLTKYGRIMSRLPLDPCLSRILLEARNTGSLKEIKIIVAALAIQDPRIRPADKEAEADEAHNRFISQGSDFLGLLKIWQTYHETLSRVHSQNKMRKFCRTHYLSWQRMREWLDIHTQISETLDQEKTFTENEKSASGKAIHQAITSGFLRNIGQKKKKNIYRINGDKEVMLFPGSALFGKGGSWVVSASFVETSRLFARTVANIDVAWLEHLGGNLCRKSWSNPHWEKKSGQVIAFEQVSLFGFVIVSGRRVNYGHTGKKARQECREIFIHSALVEARLGGNYRFIIQNLNSIRHFTNMEDRLRRRGLVVSDDQFFAFYGQRLAPDVIDRFTLNRDIKLHGGDDYLLMTSDNICREQPDNKKLYDFPTHLQGVIDNKSLKLEYHFKPGDEKDGVTVTIPRDVIAKLKPHYFEWLVPGFLPEKITLLLKALPKNLRRSLVPIPHTVDHILDTLDLGRGSLYQALEEAIFKLHRITINRKEWKADMLPRHLKFRFRLVNEKGKTLLYSRSFNDILIYQLKGGPVDRENTKYSTQLKQLEKDSISPTDLADIPESVPITHTRSKTTRVFFPTLIIRTTAHRVDLRFTEDERESKRCNHRGLRFLYSLQFPGEKKLLTKECKKEITRNSASWLLLSALKKGSLTRVELENFILDDIFCLPVSGLPGEMDFNNRVAEVRKQGFLRTGREKLAKIQKILSCRREVVTKINGCKAQAEKHRNFDKDRFAQYQTHLGEILPADFLVSRQFDHLRHVERYLKALLIRIDRGEYAPAKDQAKAKQIEPHLKRLQQISTSAVVFPLCKREIDEYRCMVEEFRVSVFAPEVGTSLAVSTKKLTKKWRSVENACHQVE